MASSPFDVVKSRVMGQPLNPDGTGKLYSGMVDCFIKSSASEVRVWGRVRVRVRIRVRVGIRVRVRVRVRVTLTLTLTLSRAPCRCTMASGRTLAASCRE